MVKPCLHCGENTQNQAEDFCCLGCSTAYKIVNKFGFENYYKLRQIDLSVRKIKPEIEEEIDVAEFISHEKDGSNSVSLIVQGLHCAACVWLIESILKKQESVVAARINLSKKTLFLRWNGDAKTGNDLVHLIHEIGYKLLPFDAEILNSADKKYSDSILRALAVAGFGVGNVMLMSYSLWFADASEMGKESRNLLHFFSSLISLPVIIFSARPFFASAWRSTKQGFPNMDLAISIAIFLACAVSLLETFRGAAHVYFDSAVMLIFFLLIGRYLDLKARKKAFAIASEFTLLSASFGRVEEDSKIKILPIKQLQEGMILVVAVGEKIAADGVVLEGESEIDTALISGETLPKKASKGSEVFAGTINLAAPLKIKITKAANNSLLSEIIRLSEEAENKKNHYIRISDYLSKFYTPAVHLLALGTFIFWLKSGWENALMNATAVLIITCPCALALAVPIVQTIVISNFIRKGILLKSGEALEKLREIDVVVFDKTGSLTIGSPRLVEMFLLQENKKISLTDSQKNSYLKLAASLASKSRHPISKAISASFEGELETLQVQENQGLGLEANFENKVLKLGRKSFCQVKNNFEFDQNLLTCFAKFGEDELVFLFEDALKSDAKTTIEALKKMGKKIILLSGDAQNPVENVAQKLQISEFYFEQTPVSKVQFLEKLKAENKKFVMVGDGLNDAPALALSHVSISFSKASDISQNIADVVICGEKLMPIIELINSSAKAISLMKQNLLIALIYNLFAVPYAMAGHVVPLIAAIAMSSSSLLVLFNSLRINSKK
ncbi:MAG: cadmium-translocating P-type ATPase [Rickettsiales bacterium]|nr:cadmium-translocating P-type ATPase [Rickettsiales bacterium]